MDEEEILKRLRRLGQLGRSQAGDALLSQLRDAGVTISMPKVKGNGLDARETVEVDLLSLATAMSQDKSLADSVATSLRAGVIPAMHAQKRRAERVLEEAGLPTTDALVKIDDNGSWSHAVDPKESGTTPGLELALADEGSRAYVAADTLRTIQTLTEARKAVLSACPDMGDMVDRIMAQAYKLGDLRGRIVWKDKHETAAIEGYRSLDHQLTRREAAKSAKKQKANENLRRVEARYFSLLKIAPELGLPGKASEAAKRIVQEPPDLGLSVETVRKLLRRIRRSLPQLGIVSTT